MVRRVRVIRKFRYGLRIFDVGEEGYIEENHDYTLTFKGAPIYDLYVKFPGYDPIGVHKNEVEEVN